MMINDMQELVDMFLDDVLRQLGNERHKNIAFTLVDVADPSSSIEGRVEIDGAYEDAHVEIRVRKRSPQRPSRFTLQAMTTDLAPETGFAGFTADGRMQSPSGIAIQGRVNMYNTYEWEPKLLKG